MLKNLSKKTKIILIVFHAVLLLILGFLAYRFLSLGEEYRRDLEYSYTRSLGEANEYLQSANAVLLKAPYTNTTTGQFAISSELRKSASGAKTAISFLPFSDDNSEKIENSLSLISDFALYIERKSSSGESLTEEDFENFETLSQHAELISNEFSSIEEKISTNSVSIGDTQKLFQKSLNLPSLPSFDENFSAVSDQLETLQDVNYDGLFSDHITKLEAEYLKGMDKINPEKAMELASEFLKTPNDELTLQHETDGALASYQIGSDDSTVKITKIGGQVAYFKKTMDIEDSKLSYEEALEKAKGYLNEVGIKDITETTHVISDNTCTINFVSMADDIIVYPDLVTVSIELNEGGMMELSSTGYLMNKKARTDIFPELPESDAQSKVSSKLEITDTKLAIIPSAGKKEVLTYEFTCKDKNTNQEVIIYINARTGYEEKISLT